ncbi:MAG: hypothetical protein LBS55_02270 [Prevotellaceae bacterium]|jgi:hypothetical protein|nr:hypothetical protein [Prevotellaceae bacterium]
MGKDVKKYSVAVIEIANYMYGHPDADSSAIASEFAKRYRKSERTIWRYMKDAREHNAQRMKKADALIEKEIIENEIKNIRNREAILREILDHEIKIMRGSARMITGTKDIIIPTDADRHKSIIYLARILGFDTEDFLRALENITLKKQQ